MFAGQDQILCRAKFGGLLCDEKASKEVLSLKGASGTKPCSTCKNVARGVNLSLLADNYLIGIECADYGRMDFHTNESFWQMIDLIIAAKPAMNKTQFEALQQSLGMSYDEDALLFDPRMRAVVSPVDHVLRDWLHMLCSGGVAGTELALICHELERQGVAMSQVTSFVAFFKLPKKRGKVDKQWFSPQRINEDQMRTPAASDHIIMVSLMRAFLEDVMVPMNKFVAHARCLSLLDNLLCRLTIGCESALENVHDIQRLIVEHHIAYVALYGQHLKPKLHQLLHLPANIVFLRKLMACFVTERKHRSVKSTGIWAFRSVEATVAQDLLIRMEARSDSPYKETCMIKPSHAHVNAERMSVSASASLRSGLVVKSDVVFFKNDNGYSVGIVLGFFNMTPVADASVSVLVEVFAITEQPHVLDSEATVAKMILASAIVAPVAWAQLSANRIRIMRPYVG